MHNSSIVNLSVERRRRGPRFSSGLMQVLEVSRDLVCVCRDGVITAINGAGYRLLGGRTSEDVVGRALAEFLMPESASSMALYLAGVSAVEDSISTYVRGPNGAALPVEMQVYRAREIANDATVVVCRPLEGAHSIPPLSPVFHGETFFHLLVENSLNPMLCVQAGVVVYINNAGLELLGANTAFDVVSRPIRQFLDMAQPVGPYRTFTKRDGVKVRMRVRIQALPGDSSNFLLEATSLP